MQVAIPPAFGRVWASCIWDHILRGGIINSKVPLPLLHMEGEAGRESTWTIFRVGFNGFMQAAESPVHNRKDTARALVIRSWNDIFGTSRFKLSCTTSDKPRLCSTIGTGKLRAGAVQSHWLTHLEKATGFCFFLLWMPGFRTWQIQLRCLRELQMTWRKGYVLFKECECVPRKIKPLGR